MRVVGHRKDHQSVGMRGPSLFPLGGPAGQRRSRVHEGQLAQLHPAHRGQRRARRQRAGELQVRAEVAADPHPRPRPRAPLHVAVGGRAGRDRSARRAGRDRGHGWLGDLG
eukprot:5420546-Alexandrium_andersonii.AAC.1